MVFNRPQTIAIVLCHLSTNCWLVPSTPPVYIRDCSSQTIEVQAHLCLCGWLQVRTVGLQEVVTGKVEVETSGWVRVEVGPKPRAQHVAARLWLQGSTASSSGCSAGNHSWWDRAQVHYHLLLGTLTRVHHSTQMQRLLLLPAASWQRCLYRTLQFEQRRP